MKTLAATMSMLFILILASPAAASSPQPTGTDQPTPSVEPTTEAPSSTPSESPSESVVPSESPTGSIDVPATGTAPVPTHTPCWEGCHSTHKPPVEHITNPPTDTLGGKELEVSTDPLILIVAMIGALLFTTAFLVRRKR